MSHFVHIAQIKLIILFIIVVEKVTGSFYIFVPQLDLF